MLNNLKVSCVLKVRNINNSCCFQKVLLLETAAEEGKRRKEGDIFEIFQWIQIYKCP